MNGRIETANDIKAVAGACVAVLDAYLRRSPTAQVGTINELDALRDLRDTLAAIDRDRAAA